MIGSNLPSNDGEPVFVIGRQHSGNTMLATLLGRHPDVYSFTGEGTFFEHWGSIRQQSDPLPAVVREVGGGADPSLPVSRRDELLQTLRKNETAGQSIVETYARGKRLVAQAEGAFRWVQKATSYVFYVDDILQSLPSSRLIFLIRNPLDLGASLKKRESWHRVLRMVWGWNRGVRLAHRWSDDRRVQLVRYEDLVRQPESCLRDVCSFAGLTFDEALLKVPHVNRSETPYNTDSSATGLNDSRVYYFRDVLSPEEEAVVRAWADTDRLRSTYPDLPEPRKHRAVHQIGLTVQAVGGLVRTLVADHASTLAQNPGHVLDRIRRRV